MVRPKGGKTQVVKFRKRRNSEIHFGKRDIN
jgi:hypothetical protein